MKNTILSFILLVAPFAFAQVQTPQPSPSSQLFQTVGLTEISVKFSRPAKKGRAIFGALVPYGKIWRTGANQNTIITFGDAVTFGENEIPAGSYAIYTRPGKNMWEVIFYNEITNRGNPADWDVSKVAATIEVVPSETKSIESFSIWISSLHNNGGTLNIGWDTTKVSLPFGVPTIAKATVSIQEAMKNNPKDRDYYNAAVYYLQEGQDLNQAKEWIAKAVAGNDKAYWYLRQRSLILAGLNEIDGAIEAAKASLELAKTAGNSDYITLNETSISEWSK
ncbi:DUF2911 domain-containing protein [Flavobacteriaceae bacterium]|jgi:hypothetical protein|nr:DUF2911 domain-containing protein [Flavobacteriaceae bacterium]